MGNGWKEARVTRKYFGVLGAAIILMCIAGPAVAGGNPISLGLFPPVQIVKETQGVSAFRFSLIYGKNTSVTGFDWGLVAKNTTGMSKGLQWAFVGLNDGDFTGWQATAVGITKGNFEGFQSGFVNSAGHVEGLQLGFVNVAQTMHGLQIGLVNIIKQGGQFPVFPIVNWSF